MADVIGDREQGAGIRGREAVIKNCRDLDVRRKAVDPIVECYRMTKMFPKNDLYGLASQLQRSAVSIPANIAEGRQRRHRKEFRHHLSIAHASLAELETHLEIACRLDYIDRNQLRLVLGRTVEIGKMLNGLRNALEKSAET